MKIGIPYIRNCLFKERVAVGPGHKTLTFKNPLCLPLTGSPCLPIPPIYLLESRGFPPLNHAMPLRGRQQSLFTATAVPRPVPSPDIPLLPRPPLRGRRTLPGPPPSRVSAVPHSIGSISAAAVVEAYFYGRALAGHCAPRLERFSPVALIANRFGERREVH